MPIWMDATVFYNVFVRIWKGKSAKCPKVINLSLFAYLSDGINYRLEILDVLMLVIALQKLVKSLDWLNCMFVVFRTFIPVIIGVLEMSWSRNCPKWVR